MNQRGERNSPPCEHADPVPGERVRERREAERRREEEVVAEPGREPDDRARFRAVVERDRDRERSSRGRARVPKRRRCGNTVTCTSDDHRDERAQRDGRASRPALVRRGRRRRVGHGRASCVRRGGRRRPGPVPGTHRNTVTNCSSPKSTNGLMRADVPSPADCSSTRVTVPTGRSGGKSAVRDVRRSRPSSPFVPAASTPKSSTASSSLPARPCRDAGDRMRDRCARAIAKSGSVSTWTFAPPRHTSIT